MDENVNNMHFTVHIELFLCTCELLEFLGCYKLKPFVYLLKGQILNLVKKEKKYVSAEMHYHIGACINK